MTHSYFKHVQYLLHAHISQVPDTKGNLIFISFNIKIKDTLDISHMGEKMTSP